MGLFHVIIPEATTNLITNPSFETGTTSWATAGTNTLSQNSDFSFNGHYCLKCVYSDNTILAYYNLSLTASTTYVASAWVRVGATWDNGNIALKFLNFTDGTETINQQWLVASDPLATWFYLETQFDCDTDTVGTLQFRAAAAPSGTPGAWMDSVQLEELSYATTYCDGDQPGCQWNGTPHASTSTRSALSMAGGKKNDLADDLSFYTEVVTGVGAVQPIINYLPYAMLPGALYQSTKIQPTVMTITGTFVGGTLAQLHDDRKAVIQAFAPSGILANQPVRLRYTGGTTEKEIAAYYEGGLEFSARVKPYEENASARFLALDPFWYSVGDSSTVLDTYLSQTYKYMGGKIDGVWTNMGPPSSVGGVPTVFAIIRHLDGNIYVGGAFASINADTDMSNVAYWDGSSWNPTETGADNTIYNFAIGPDGYLYACGEFNDIGTATNTRGVAYWDGTNWNDIGSPGAATTNNGVYAMEWDKAGRLYIGGDFTDWDGTAASDYLAKWNGSAWLAVATGGTGAVYTIASYGVNQFIFGGAFTAWDGDGDQDYIAEWNGSAYAALTTATTNGDVNVLKYGPDGFLYACGAFTTIGGNTDADYIARWNGTAFDTLGTSPDAEVEDIVFGPDGMLWAAGNFTSAGGDSRIIRIGRWNGYTWWPADIAPGSAIYAIEVGKPDPITNKIYDVFFGFSGSAAIVTSDDVTVTNAGNVIAFPVIKIFRSGGTAPLGMIRNETNGRELVFANYTLADEEILTIDLRPGKQLATSNLHGYMPDIFLEGSDVSNFVLEPGDNVITGRIGTGAAATTLIRFKTPFKSFDD